MFRAFARRIFVIYPRRRSQLELLRKRITYEVDSNDTSKVIYRKFYEVRARVDGLNSLTDVYRWSGTDTRTPVLRNADGFRLVHLGPDSVWEKYEVIFPAELPRGGTYEFELEWALDNSDGKAQPFVSSPINEPTRLLEFELRLPDAWYPQRVWYEKKRSIDSTHVFASKALSREGDGAIRWKVDDPSLCHYYMIKWIRNGNP